VLKIESEVETDIVENDLKRLRAFFLRSYNPSFDAQMEVEGALVKQIELLRALRELYVK